MNVGDLIQVSPMGRNKLGITHFSIDAVKLVNGINTQKEVEDVKSK